MKVLHLLQSDRFSGAENVVCQIIAMFKNTPNIDTVYSSRDGQVREALAERGIAFAPLKDLTVSEVKRVIREQKPNIIHAHDMRASFVAALVCGKIPLVSHIHNNNFDSRGLTPKSIAYLLAGWKARHIFWVSQSSFNGYFFHKWFAKKSEVLYNVISIEDLYKKAALDTNTYDYDVVFIGRLTRPKNPHRLMHVFAKAVECAADIKIAVIGTGELEAETKQLCTELGLDANVHFLGFQSNPLKILQDAKVMVMTSLWEGTPMCALESLALGVPIVSTPTDGLRELVKEGANGYLSDDDNTLAEKMLSIVKDPALHAALSENAVLGAKEYNDKEKYQSMVRHAYGL